MEDNIPAAGGGAGGAPTDATYLTKTANGVLTAERETQWRIVAPATAADIQVQINDLP